MDWISIDMHQHLRIPSAVCPGSAQAPFGVGRIGVYLLVGICMLLTATGQLHAQGSADAARASLNRSAAQPPRQNTGRATVDTVANHPQPISGSFGSLGVGSLTSPAPTAVQSNWFTPTADDTLQIDALQPSATFNTVSRPVESAPLPISMEGRFDGPDAWRRFPAGLMYRSYVAGEREPRISGVWLNEKDRGMVLETALGGRAGLLRYGTADAINPQGFQLDIEGAGLARVDPEEHSDLEGADFRFGCVGTWQYSPWAYKAGYYHISSHMGDEFLLRTGATDRRNYVRDALIFGARYDFTDDINLYGEVGYAPNHNGGAEPLELQFGAEFNPKYPTGPQGSPVLAINSHLREEFDFGGSVNVIWGWQWKGETGSAFRVGMQYYNGPSIQWSFFDQHEEFVGGGMWFDF